MPSVSLNQLIKLNGTLITEHNRTFADAIQMQNVDLELANGTLKRYYKPSKLNFNFSWKFCPDKASMSVDGKAARDFIYNACMDNTNILLSIQKDRNSEWLDYVCMMNEYAESLVRIDIANQTKFYDISISLSEL